jgi:hypothetical protein
VFADYPQNVLDRYDPLDAGNCDKPLGTACVQAMLDGMLDAAYSSPTRCPVPEIDWLECKGVFLGDSANTIATSEFESCYCSRQSLTVFRIGHVVGQWHDKCHRGRVRSR